MARTQTNTYVVYALKCPLKNHVKYIGCTKDKIKTRYSQHLSANKRTDPKSNWIRQLQELKLRPILFIFKENLSMCEGKLLEQDLIRRHSRTGNLLNVVYKNIIKRYF